MNRRNRLGKILTFIILMGGGKVLPAQALHADTRGTPVSAQAEGNSGGNSPGLEQHYPRYALQQEDVLSISFPLTPELNEVVTVQPDGYIDLKSAGSLRVQGMTLPELTNAIKKAYVGVLQDPIVDVDIKDFRKPFFSVSGQVGKPGQYELRNDITIAEAVAIAGGLAPTAKTQIFLFHRTSDAWMKVEKFNLKSVLDGKNPGKDALVKPGDMIYVPESFITNFRKYVPYSVNLGTYFQPNSP
jgi:polysaccharide export outer membrane protein